MQKKILKTLLKSISITALFLLLFSYNLKASGFSVEVADTLVPSGKIYNIPVFGQLPDVIANNISIKLNFNALIIDIKSAIGSPMYGFQEESLIITSTVHTWESVDITVSSSSFKTNYSGILFYLQVEALVGPDTLTALSPIELKLDNILQTAEFSSGIIKTTPPIVSQKYKEGISYCYPNPFAYSSAFRFTVEDESNIGLKIFSSYGRLVTDIANGTEDIEYKIFDNQNNLVDFSKDKLFEPGVYRLEFIPFSDKFSSGVYYVTMKTKKGIYYTNFVYVK